ncbi:LOW QUALITY PROTEIN: hypothetical protein HID58_086621 [Brassica napus]|uniref:Sulfotransferase n=1 Tax=Brassica napus TaxID=3708 RepID=A0ABQ7XTY9_BRANA|nr:LOW QUALITY PROTEIN: hypothetical protein HID58_086621 [Brassica napus]
MYQFQGRWHTQALLQGILTCQKHFEAKDSEIILVTNPKSGVYYESPDFDFSQLSSPRLMNTHISHLSLPESVKSSSCKICCRNPKDMEVYCWTILGSCVGVLVCEPRESEQGLVVTYEELKKQTEVEVKRIAEFIGCGFTAEEEVREIVKLCSFESLSRLEVNRQGKLPNGIETNAFFRKGEIGGWRDTLSESLADAIDRITEEKHVQRIKRVLAAVELSKWRTLKSLCCTTFKIEKLKS